MAGPEVSGTAQRGTDGFDGGERIRPPIALRVASVVLLAAAGYVAFALGGDPEVGGDDIGEGAVNLAGSDLAVDDEVLLDFGTEIPVFVADRFAEAGAAQVSVDLSIGGLTILSGAPAPLERNAAESVAAVDLSQAQFLIGGPVDATLELQDADGRAVVTREFGVEPDSSGLLSAGAVVAAALSLIVVASSQSLVRPMRRSGRPRIGSLVGLGIMGALAGLALSLFGWMVAGTRIEVRSVAPICVLAAAGCVVAGLASARAARRRRVETAVERPIAGATGSVADVVAAPAPFANSDDGTT